MQRKDIIKLKNQVIIFFLLFLVVVIIYYFLFGPGKRYEYLGRIDVWADGEAIVSPDIANLFISVISEGTAPKVLAENNTKQMSAAIDFIKSYGIEEKDIKTTKYELVPCYAQDEKTKKTYITHYTLTHTILVKLRDLAKVPEIVGGLPPLGINQISVFFDIDDREKYLREARTQALEKAKEKAKSMAEKLGVKLVRLSNIYEQMPYPEDIGGMGGSYPLAADALAAHQTLPQIPPGAQKIRVQVNLSYEIK